MEKPPTPICGLAIRHLRRAVHAQVAAARAPVPRFALRLPLMLPWTAELCLDRIGREALYEPGESDDLTLTP